MSPLSTRRFPNFRIPIFSSRFFITKKKEIPRVQGRHTRGIFSAQCRQPVQLAEHASTESAEKHQSFMLFFQSSFTSILIAAMTSSNDCFSASSTVVRFLHCIPQVQALKVLTYDKRLFVSSIRIYRQSCPRTLTTPNIYHHMGKLVQAKFVNTRIDRNRNYYSINQLLDELKGILRC